MLDEGDEGEAELPPSKPLPFSDITTQHIFVGDETFPLKLYMRSVTSSSTYDTQ